MELTTAANKTGRKSWLEDNRIEVEARLKLKQEQMLDQVIKIELNNWGYFFFIYSIGPVSAKQAYLLFLRSLWKHSD